MSTPRRIITSFEARELKKRSFTVKIADFLTSRFGGVGFLLLNLGFFFFWIIVNSGKIPQIPAFDSFPFLLLSVVVSSYAIILSIIILISQNRENQVNTLRQELQLQVGLITEKEITKILEILKEIAEKQGIKLGDEELEQMIKEIDTSYIERRLEEQLSGKPEPLIKKVAEEVEKTLSPKA